MKRGTPDHPKTRALAAALGIERWGAVGILESLWHFAAQYARRGDIGRFSDDVIADSIGWKSASSVLVECLQAAGWVDSCPCHRLRIHDWPEHSDQTLQRSREVKTHGFLECYGDASSVLADSQQETRRRTDLPMPLPTPTPTPTPTPEPGESEGGPVAARAAPSPVGKGKPNGRAKPKRSPPSAWALTAAEALAKATARRWPGCPLPRSLPREARELERIRAPAEQVAGDVAWYTDRERDGQEYLPECRAASSFRRKYDQVRAARLRPRARSPGEKILDHSRKLLEDGW